ncbi:MAG TPA: acyltransferase, partial [Candidatus Limnocylindria bacterium]|nr:acyltransferase [Candidatus Limnocylindria bacterium]
SNWLAVAGVDMGLLGHTWSLSVEEHFYVVWPAVLLGALALGGQRLALGVAVGGAIASLALRIAIAEVAAGQRA